MRYASLYSASISGFVFIICDTLEIPIVGIFLTIFITTWGLVLSMEAMTNEIKEELITQHQELNEKLDQIRTLLIRK